MRREDQEPLCVMEYFGGGNPERIAEDWARQFDFSAAEVAIAKGGDYLVTVENLHLREQWVFRVCGETRPIYRITAVMAGSSGKRP